MLTYKNRLSDVLLPFVDAVPFPIGYITHISLCIPQSLPVYVTSVVSQPDQFTMGLAAGKLQNDILEGVYSCTFTYKKNLQIVSTGQSGMTGVLVLAHLPQQSFAYTGMWQVHNRYVCTQRDISSYTYVSVNGTRHPVNQVLDIKFKGSVQVTGTMVARQADLSFGVPSIRTACVSSVNNMRVKKLYIKSSDSCIDVGAPVSTGSTVTVYINTYTGFPTCSGS